MDCPTMQFKPRRGNIQQIVYCEYHTVHFANDSDFSTKESQIVDTRFPRVNRLRCFLKGTLHRCVVYPDLT